MSAYRRNTLVGITMLGALVILAWMIIQFGGALANPFAPKQIKIRITTDRADGVSDGTAVLFRGVANGRVDHVYLKDIQHVIIEGIVDAEPALPANLKAFIKPNGLIGGGASIYLEMSGDQPEGKLKDNAELIATYTSLDLLPASVGDLAGELRQTAEMFRKAHVIEDFDATVKHIGDVAQSMQQIAGDTGTQGNLKTALDNISQSTADIRKFTAKLDKMGNDASDTLATAKDTLNHANTQVQAISQQVSDRMVQLAKLLDNVNAITTKVNNGQGTAGQLVNDPKLYASLVDTAQEMDATVKDLKRLVEQWEQEGVSLKLK